MNVSYAYSHTRAQKARLARRLVNGPLETILALLTASFLGVGVLFIMNDLAVGGLLVAVGLVGFMVWQWIDGDLKNLDGTLGQGAESLELAEVLDVYVLARLPKEYSLSDVMIACSGSWQHVFFLNRYGLSADDLVTQVDLADADSFWSTAIQLAIEHKSPDIDAGMLFVAAVQTIPGIDAWLSARKLTKDDIVAGLHWQFHLEKTIEEARKKEDFGGVARDWNFGYTPLLNQFGHNITQEVQFSGFIHRDTAVHSAVVGQMLKILNETSRQNVVLVGDVGSGKSTSVYALAKRLLLDASTPQSIQYHQIFSLSAPSLLANNAQPGQLERTMIMMINEALRAKNIILFFDDAHGFFSSEQSTVDLSNLLLPVIEGGRVRIIFSMTPKQWQEISRRNESLAGLLNYIAVNESSDEETMRILEDQILLLEGQHKVVYSYFALKEAIRLGARYVHEQAFPGKAIRLLELAATHNQGGLVSGQSVQVAIEQTRGVKVTDATQDEVSALLNLEDQLHQRVINQTKAVEAIANALRRARSGVGSPKRPVGTFLFLGPTGVGKTELSKALAEVYYGGEGHLIRIDMNEFSSSADVQRFISAAGGGGLSLVEQIRKQPYSVILLDEIEKAHSDVLNVLLQVLDEGRMKDSDEREVLFRDAIIIATSNAGADQIRQRISDGQDVETMTDELTNQLIADGVYKPEFINRFDEIVIFRPLTPDELLLVVDLLIKEVNKTLAQQHVSVALTDAAKTWLVQQGYDPQLGARPLRRVVQKSVENVVAAKLLKGELTPGSNALLDVADLQ